LGGRDSAAFWRGIKKAPNSVHRDQKLNIVTLESELKGVCVLFVFAKFLFWFEE
jgi:hypothetical protein